MRSALVRMRCSLQQRNNYDVSGFVDFTFGNISDKVTYIDPMENSMECGKGFETALHEEITSSTYTYINRVCGWH